MPPFKIVADFKMTGDQPQAVDRLEEGLNNGFKHQTLLGVTGSGKTFTIANVIERLQRPTLVICHNKTLAAQLSSEFREFFPENAVEYFVSYYDYYQPEAYVPSSDTYIEKESTINDDIDRMRHAATRSLLERNDVLIVASVSCIYGLGSAEAYYDMLVFLEQGIRQDRDAVLRKLVEIQYERNDIDFHRGTFRVRGDVVEVFPAHEEAAAVRIEWFDDEIEAIAEIDPLRGKILRSLEKIAIYPNSHYVTTGDHLKNALKTTRRELVTRLAELRGDGRELEAQRLEQRTLYDLEMLDQTGHCHGIENYSRHLTGRPPGQPPPCLLDFFPDDLLVVLDESHVTVPQVAAMFRGDRARKETLVEHGFRLPSALDNRPLTFAEFEERVRQVIHVSATPGDYEMDKTAGVVVEQVIRPTGLLDPAIEVRPANGQVDDLLEEIRTVAARGERVLVTVLTKRMAEDLTEYLLDLGVRVRYMHADIDTLERVRIIHELRTGSFDVLVGINLLREGLDLPEVSLVAVLDADKEGFLRSARSLVQTCGRAARNVRGRVILYGDRVTAAMAAAQSETDRRRHIQRAHNEEHGIVARTVQKGIADVSDMTEGPPGAAGERRGGPAARSRLGEIRRAAERYGSPEDIAAEVARLTTEMREAADRLEFEHAAELRDRIAVLRKAELAFR